MMTQRVSSLFRVMAVALIVIMLAGLTGGTARGMVSAKQSSFIVQATSADLAASLVAKYQGVVTSRLDIINGVAATLTDQSVAQLRHEKAVVAITANGPVKSSDGGDNNKDGDKKDKKEKVPSTDYPELVGADAVWAQGDTGAGVTVAVVDTGLGELSALTKGADGKPGRIVAWKDFIEDSKQPRDPNGHGSHVAGIISNSQKDDNGVWNGVAPGVNLVGVRVLDDQGAGTYESVISGLQWVITNKTRYNIRIVNLSMVAPVQSAYWADPLNQAVTKAWASGLMVIVAAGNGGPGPLSISVPGNNPYVVTVGAFTDAYTPNDWKDDYITPFSGAGPTLDGFVKPDLIAPGAHSVSVVPNNSVLSDQYPANELKGNYFKLAGTSQSTAVVTGIAALILSQHPELTPNEVKQRLTGSALPWIDPNGTDALYSMWQQGAGRANAPDAVFADISGAANAGMDINADLAGQHYQGYSYYDEATGSYHLYAPYDNWAGGYGAWAGGYGAWAGGYGAWAGGYGAWAGGYGAWAGGYGAWAGGYGAWAGGYGAWAGGYGAWAGGYGAWAGGHGAWAGGYGAWAGGHGAWAGGHGAWAGSYADPAFVASYISGASPNAAISKAAISYFLQDP